MASTVAVTESMSRSFFVKIALRGPRGTDLREGVTVAYNKTDYNGLGPRHYAVGRWRGLASGFFSQEGALFINNQ